MTSSEKLYGQNLSTILIISSLHLKKKGGEKMIFLLFKMLLLLNLVVLKDFFD